MLEVKIYMVPFGIREAQRELFSIKIWNKGHGSTDIGDYGYEITGDKDLEIKGDLDKYERKNGALVLLKEILEDAL